MYFTVGAWALLLAMNWKWEKKEAETAATTEDLSDAAKPFKGKPWRSTTLKQLLVRSSRGS